MDEIETLKQSIQESGEYVGSVSTRKNISDFYRNQWLPVSQEFQTKFGDDNFRIIDENAFTMYELAKSPKPSKTKLLNNIKEIASILERLELKSIREQGSSFELSLTSTPQSNLLTKNVNFEKEQVAEINHSENKRAVFVIHGRDLAVRDSMFDFLRALDLHPLEWSELIKSTGSSAPYIGEVLDKAFSEAQAIVVLMTPDDEKCLREHLRGKDEPPHEKELTPQPRLNVIFEAGMAMGRRPDRTIIVEVGSLRSFSDIAGRHTVRLDGSVEKRLDLVHRLENAGCLVNTKGISWLKAGKFTTSEKSLKIMNMRNYLRKN